MIKDKLPIEMERDTHSKVRSMKRNRKRVSETRTRE